VLAIEARESRNAVFAALLMHGALVGALLVSLNWSRQAPRPVQAELWGNLPAPVPAHVPAPVPPPPVEPPKPVSPKAVPPPSPVKADISLEKKKQDDAKKLAAEKKLAAQREADRLAAQKKLAEKEAAARIDARRAAELARLGLDPNAKATGKSKDVATKAGVVGGAEVGDKTGELADYAAMIRARVLARIRFDPSRAPGNPEVIFIVEQLPSGEISGIRKTKSSGVVAWDEAVERAIRASDPLPKKKDGTVERVLELRFRPNEDR
jgi:colicin import membrane protein